MLKKNTFGVKIPIFSQKYQKKIKITSYISYFTEINHFAVTLFSLCFRSWFYFFKCFISHVSILVAPLLVNNATNTNSVSTFSSFYIFIIIHLMIIIVIINRTIIIIDLIINDVISCLSWSQGDSRAISISFFLVLQKSMQNMSWKPYL